MTCNVGVSLSQAHSILVSPGTQRGLADSVSMFSCLSLNRFKTGGKLGKGMSDPRLQFGTSYSCIYGFIYIAMQVFIDGPAPQGFEVVYN